MNSTDPTGLIDHSVAAAQRERHAMVDRIRQTGLGILAEEEARYEEMVQLAFSGLLQNIGVTVSISEGTTGEPPPQKPDASTNNGNATDIRTDQKLAKVFTNTAEGGILRGASSGRAASREGDTHYKLGDGRVHTIHIYGDASANAIVGVYIPKGFAVTYVGGDYNTVVATNGKTVIGIAHVKRYNYGQGRKFYRRTLHLTT